MQLSSRPTIRQALAIATCTLLTGSADAATDNNWTLHSSLLSYSEQNRVSVIEPTLFATTQLDEDESLTTKLVYDSLTGASPNGAAPTNSAQTFTGASGASAYTTPAGQLPTRRFSDTRVALGLDWNKRTSRLLTRGLGFNISTESDYSSLGGTLNFARDLQDRLTTFALGVGFTQDWVNPHGGPPTALQSTSLAVSTPATATPATVTRSSGGGTTSNSGSGELNGGGFQGKSKTTTDLLLGVTQVLSRRTLLQFNYTRSVLNGYLTDPYKILSVISPSSGQTVDYVYEKRPDSRHADAFYLKLVHHFDQDVVHLAFRYFRDDWGIQSHTSELQYDLKLGDTFYVEPQLRYYTQTAANFFRNSLIEGETVDFASADLRLGEMTSTTAGLRIGMHIGDGELSFRYAKMRQTGNSHPADAIGVQTQVDLNPALDATIMNLNYSVRF